MGGDELDRRVIAGVGSALLNKSERAVGCVIARVRVKFVIVNDAPCVMSCGCFMLGSACRQLWQFESDIFILIGYLMAYGLLSMLI